MILGNVKLLSQPLYKPATIYLANQDSLKGNLRYSFPWKPVLKKGTFKFQSFEKEAVDSYQFSNGKYFQKYKLKYFDNSVEDVYSEVYVKGDISYVSHKKRQYLKIDSLDHLVRLTSNNYPGVFSLVMPQQPDLVEQAKTMKYNKGNIINLLKEYHDAENLEYIEYETEKDKIHFDFLLFYGFSNRKLNILEALVPVADQDNSVAENKAFSIMSNITVPGFSRIISFNLGLERVNGIQFDTNYRFGRTGTGIIPTEFLPLEFSMSVTNLLFGLNFNVQSRYVSPYFGFGAIKSYIGKQDSNFAPAFSLRNDFLGYYISTGLILDFHPNVKPVLGLRYDNVTGTTASGSIVNGLLSTNFQNIQFNVGVKIFLLSKK